MIVEIDFDLEYDNTHCFCRLKKVKVLKTRKNIFKKIDNKTAKTTKT